MKVSVFPLFLVILLMYSCTGQQDITEQEAINAIKKFDNGWEYKNMTAVDSVLSPKYIYFTQSGNTFSRDSVVATSGENDYLLHDMSRSEIEVTLTGNTAVVSSRWKGQGRGYTGGLHLMRTSAAVWYL